MYKNICKLIKYKLNSLIKDSLNHKNYDYIKIFTTHAYLSVLNLVKSEDTLYTK